MKEQEYMNMEPERSGITNQRGKFGLTNTQC